VTGADVVRRLQEAFEAGDLETQLSLIDPDVVIAEWPDTPDPKTGHGHAGVAAIAASWAEVWEWLRTDVDEFVEAGDRVLAIGRTRGKGKGSEIEVDIDSFNVYTVRDGKVTRMEFFTSKEPALRAAGIEEDAA
jgi:ketosteroid isomerase-like protein